MLTETVPEIKNILVQIESLLQLLIPNPEEFSIHGLLSPNPHCSPAHPLSVATNPMVDDMLPKRLSKSGENAPKAKRSKRSAQSEVKSEEKNAQCSEENEKNCDVEKKVFERTDIIKTEPEDDLEKETNKDNKTNDITNEQGQKNKSQISSSKGRVALPNETEKVKVNDSQADKSRTKNSNGDDSQPDKSRTKHSNGDDSQADKPKTKDSKGSDSQADKPMTDDSNGDESEEIDDDEEFQEISDDSEEEYDEEELGMYSQYSQTLQFVRESGYASQTYSLDVEINQGEVHLVETPDNSDLLQNLRDTGVLVRSKYLPMVQRWLEVRIISPFVNSIAPSLSVLIFIYFIFILR